jgi:hypothetical protein
MRDYIHIGTVPNDEPCLQEGRDLTTHIKLECAVYATQILQYYPAPEKGEVGIKDSEVICYFDDNDDTSSQWALDVESDVLGRLFKWDKIATKRLHQLVNEDKLPSDYFTRRM